MQLSRGLRHLTIGATAKRIFGLLNVAVLLRFLSLVDYGLLSLIYSIYNLLDLLMGLKQGDLVVAHCSQARGKGDRKEAEELFQSYLLLIVIGAGLIMSVSLLGKHLFLRRYPVLASIYWPLLAGILFTPIKGIINVYLRIKQDFGLIKLTDIVRSIGLTSGYVILVGWLGEGLRGAIIAYAIASFMPLFFVGRRLISEATRSIIRPTIGPMVALLRGEGKWQLSRYGIVTLHGSARPWLIQLVLGTEAVALFQAAKAVIGIPKDILPIKNVLIPLMSHELPDRNRLDRLYADACRYATWLFSAMAIGIVLLAPGMFTVVFPKYQEAIPVIQLMSLNFLTAGLGHAQIPLFYALRLQMAYFFTTAINLGSMLIFSVPFMLMFGVQGMALIFVLNGIMITLIRHYYLIRRFPEISFTWANLVKLSHQDRQFVKNLLLGG